ncbi:hypothetical protein FBU31_001885 [Coemansia sp. 'formosensis']|nr:hypothetical protein FBU31_001885 [Coemansia sp. 'formosensis']
MEMLAAYKDGETIRAIIDGFTDDTSFTKAWENLRIKYPMLCDFAGGLATIFANSATVEADFSRLKRVKDTNRESLTDLSLEGVLQAEYYEALFRLGGIDI